MKDLPNQTKVLELVGGVDTLKRTIETASVGVTTEAPTDVIKQGLQAQQNDQQIRPDSDLGFLREMVDLIMKDAVLASMDRNSKMCNWKSPEELRTLLTDLPIAEGPASRQQLIDMSRKIIEYSVKTVNPRFFNQLYGGMDQYSLAGCWLTEALNGSLYTYEVAPVFTIMETEIYEKMLKCIGFDGGDAIFAPGGSLSNLYAMNVARYYKFPEVKTKGIYGLGKAPCIFTSEKCHYSIGKAAATLGLGTEMVFLIKTDENGKMIPDNLREQIQKSLADGYAPFFVNATAGTTVMGAYDPLEAIADICQEFDLWMHVDGAWGGSAILSKKYKHFVKGVERADSMTWNPHKLMGAPQQCSLFLTKHKDALKQCHSANAAYLFQQDKHYDPSYDIGDASLQCGRKVDVLKLWMSWKGRGDIGMERDIDHLFMLSRYLAEQLKKTEGFRLMFEPQCTNVCFYYIPPSMRGQSETKEWWESLSKVGPRIKAGMMKAGTMMIGYQPDGKFVNFFRMVLSNFDTTTEDMDFLIQEIDRLGQDI